MREAGSVLSLLLSLFAIHLPHFLSRRKRSHRSIRIGGFDFYSGVERETIRGA